MKNRAVKFLLIMLLVCLACDIVLAEGGSSEFQRIKTPLEIVKFVTDLPVGTLIFFDIDDTIITPVSKTFRIDPYNKLIDEIKKNKKFYKNYEQIVSNWRLTRKVMLLDPSWPHILKNLKERFCVYGLTKMDSGRFGNIPSMDQWRYSELKALGIEFSEDLVMMQSPHARRRQANQPTFYHGIFLSGSASKGETLEKYRLFFNAKTMVMVDDRIEHLKDVKAFCDKYAIKFIGILFQGVGNLKDRPDPKVVAFQRDYLIRHAQWLEDEEANARIKATARTP